MASPIPDEPLRYAVITPAGVLTIRDAHEITAHEGTSPTEQFQAAVRSDLHAEVIIPEAVEPIVVLWNGGRPQAQLNSTAAAVIARLGHVWPMRTGTHVLLGLSPGTYWTGLSDAQVDLVRAANASRTRLSQRAGGTGHGWN